MITEHPQFFTATILQWKKLLAANQYKDIIMQSLKFLVDHNRVFIYGFQPCQVLSPDTKLTGQQKY